MHKKFRSVDSHTYPLSATGLIIIFTYFMAFYDIVKTIFRGNFEILETITLRLRPSWIIVSKVFEITPGNTFDYILQSHEISVL